MQAKRLFHRPFDINKFRRATQSDATQPPSDPVPPPRCETPVTTEPPRHMDAAVPQFVKKPVPTPPRNPLEHMLPPPLITDGLEGVVGPDAEDAGTKKHKKHKKEKKHRRRGDDVENEEELGLHMLCQAAGIDQFASTPTPVTFGSPVPAVTAGENGKKRAFEEAFASHAVDYDFDAYMRTPAGQTVNDEVRGRHLAEVSAVSSAGGKSLGERKYGCTFCGALHQLDCLEKGGDPPCVRGGAFAKFIQDFLFRYDIAPDQEWRRMFLARAPGFRRAMAERFAVITSTDDDEWTSFVQRRAWDTRNQLYRSSAGTSRELFQQNRASEFLFFNSSGASSSPRPSSTVTTALSPVPFAMGSFGSVTNPSSMSPPPPPSFLYFS